MKSKSENLKVGIGSRKNQPDFDVTMWWYRVLMYRSYRRRARYRVLFFRTFRSVRYRYRCRIDTGNNSGTDVHIGNGGNDMISHRAYQSVRYRYESLYRYRRYRYSYRTELADMSGTGIDVPNFLKCLVPVLMSCRIHRWVRYRYLCTEVTEASGTCTDVVPNLQKCPVSVTALPVSMSYRTYRSVRYRY